MHVYMHEVKVRVRQPSLQPNGPARLMAGVYHGLRLPPPPVGHDGATIADLHTDMHILVLTIRSQVLSERAGQAGVMAGLCVLLTTAFSRCHGVCEQAQ